MATRTIKLMGEAYSTAGDVSLVVNFNNTEVFNGTVTTNNAEAPESAAGLIEITSWTIDTSLTGNVSLTISSNNGDFYFTNLIGNYSGYELNELDEVVTAPVDYFADLNVNSTESDGKENVSFSSSDGDPQVRSSVTDDISGDWTYKIEDGVTFSCDFVIDPALVITEIPTP